jgi:hypothetical protein
MDNEPGAGRGPLKHETGSLDAVKGQTDQESNDPAQDMRADNASRLGGHKCRRGEKHGGSQGRSATYASFRRPVVGLNFTRGQKALSLIGTAGRGPACPVVWDPGANYSRGPD